MNDPKFPYHRAVQEDMLFLKEHGLEAFEKRVTERYTCSECGTFMSWFAKSCPGCGKAVPDRA
jgi:rubrerythrin